MALGEQFENTSWEDPETGIVHSWTRERNADGTLNSAPTYRQNASAEDLKDHQSLLFHPATGTGLKEDPLVPISRRKNAAARALGVEKVEPYTKRAYSMLGEYGRNNPISKKTAIKDMVGAREALVDSFAPIEEIERINAPIAVNPREGSQYAEEHSGRIRLSRVYKTREVEVPERQVPVTSTSNDPVHNPNFWKWYDKHGDNLTPEGRYALTVDPVTRYGDDTRTSMWHNPETGHTGTFEEVRQHLDIADDGIEDSLDYLQSKGYFPNIFPGKSKTSAKHSSDDFSAETESWETGNFGNRSLHARWKPAEVTFRTEPARTEIVRGAASVNERVLMHEIGHTRDPILDDPYTTRTHIVQESKRSNRHRSGWSPERRLSRGDPVNEGLADGYADRFAPSAPRGRHYAGHGEEYEDAITDPSTEMDSGYGITSGSWKNKTHKALYVAARAHARSSDTAVETGTINRDDLMRSLAKANWDDPDKYDPKHNRKHLEEGNTMALGYMYQNMPHIREHLEHHGFGDVARQAHGAYLDRSGEEHYDIAAKREAHYAAQRKNPKAKMWELPPLPPSSSDIPIPGTEKW